MNPQLFSSENIINNEENVMQTDGDRILTTKQCSPLMIEGRH